MKIRRLDHVAIHVKDVEASSKFYREVLRLEPLPRPMFDFPGAWFRLQRLVISLMPDPWAPVRGGN